ncbi:MAG: TonB-dependent receptor domain-containing protein [Candidatus Tyrphobacter sp.]
MLALVVAWTTFASSPVVAQIAPGVTQSAAHTANITGTVRSSSGAPIAGAKVTLTGPSVQSTASRADGSFTFLTVPWGTYEITVTSSLGTASRSNITINGDLNVAIQYEAPSNLRTIAHVSTTSSGAHINVTSSSITSVSPHSYLLQGSFTWKELFAQVPGVAESGNTDGGGIFAGVIPDSPNEPVLLSINGALPYETSTTIDGMPLQGTSDANFIENPGGGSDLSMLPLNAFATADIVRGPGSNAPSIVDSIGGSLVLHPPGPVTEDHFDFSEGNDEYGGSITNATAALRLGRLSATFYYAVNDSPGPLGNKVGITADLSTAPSTINGQTVQFANTGTEVYPGHGTPYCFCSLTDSLLVGGVPYSSAWTTHSGAVDFAYQISPSITAEVFYAGQRSHAPFSAGYWPVDFSPGPSYSGSLAPSPAGQTTYSFPWTLPVSEDQMESLLEEKLTAFFGGGVLRLSAVQNNTFLYYPPGGSPEALDDGTYTLWGTANVGPTSPGTPTAYDGTQARVTFPDYLTYEPVTTKNRDLMASYALQVGSRSTFGVSFVTSYYDNPYEDLFALGTTPLFSISQSAAASDTTDETRVHFDTDITDRLSVGLSWYFAQSDFHVPVPNNTTQWTDSIFRYNAPRVGIVWRPTPDIAVRGSAGGGFALPALYTLTGYSRVFSAGEYDETVGNIHLKPEQSFGYDLGTDVRLHRDTVLSFDAYQTNLYGQYYTNTVISTFNGLPLYINESGNLANSRYEGINLDVQRTVASGVYWRGTLAFTRSYVLSVPPGFYDNPATGCVNCTNQDIIPGINFNGYSNGGAVPYTSASALLGYRWHPGTYFDLAPTYYGFNNIYDEPHAFIELDAHAGYAITRNIDLIATFRNVTGFDQGSEENFAYIGDLTPVVHGSNGFWPGAFVILPYGPRAVTVTADWHYSRRP